MKVEIPDSVHWASDVEPSSLVVRPRGQSMQESWLYLGWYVLLAHAVQFCSCCSSHVTYWPGTQITPEVRIHFHRFAWPWTYQKEWTLNIW